MQPILDVIIFLLSRALKKVQNLGQDMTFKVTGFDSLHNFHAQPHALFIDGLVINQKRTLLVYNNWIIQWTVHWFRQQNIMVYGHLMRCLILWSTDGSPPSNELVRDEVTSFGFRWIYTGTSTVVNEIYWLVWNNDATNLEITMDYLLWCRR